MVDGRIGLISAHMSPDHPFWKTAEKVWSEIYLFANLRSTLAQLFDTSSAPPARDWQALLCTLMALAQDGTAQLRRAWPDDDIPALFNAFAVFGSSEVPEPVRVHDIDFIGARVAAKRARTGTGTVAHPIQSAIPMDTILATPPRQILRRAEQVADAADARSRGAERRSVETARQLDGVRHETARQLDGVREDVSTLRQGVEVELVNIRQGVQVELGTLRSAAASVEPMATAAAQAVHAMREEMDTLRRTMSSSEQAAVGPLRAALDEAVRRLRMQDTRTDQAEARVAATEQVLAQQQSDLVALRDAMRNEVVALRNLAANADSAAASSIASTLADAERRLRAQEERVAAADARHAHTERAITEQRAELDALKRIATSADPTTAAAVRIQIAAIESRIGQDTADIRQEMSALRGGLRDEVANLRRTIATAEPPSIGPLTAALAAADQRLRLQEARAAQVDARMAATERGMAGLRDTLRNAEPTSATEDAMAALEARLTAKFQAAVDTLNRNTARTPFEPQPHTRFDDHDPPRHPPRPHSVHPLDTMSEPDAALPMHDADMTRPEFYLRGDDCVRWWMSCGVGVDVAVTHAFRTAFHDVIIANLNGADVGYAKDALDASVSACAALAAGRTTSELVTSTSRSVTFLVVKAVYDGQRAGKVATLLRQAQIPDAFRHVLQASAYDVGATSGTRQAPHALRPTLRPFEEAAEVAPTNGRRARSTSRSRQPPTTRPLSKQPKSKPSGKGGGPRPSRPPHA